nr:hypothetical protein [Tanacetum cinerariifolium]
KSSGHDRPRLLMLQLLWGMVTGSNVDFAKLIWDEFKHQIETRSLPKNTNEEERVDHSKKLKGLETLSEAAQLKLDMKKTHKASKDDFFIQQHFKGLGEISVVTLEFKSDLEIAVEDIYSDDDEVTEKPNEFTKNTNEVTEKDNEVTVKPGAITKNADHVTIADEVEPAD